MKMDTNILEEIGLTNGETKVYLGLLKLGPTKIGPLIAESCVSASKIYKILDRLQSKGLAGHIIDGKIKHFKAMPPNSILDYIEENEKKLKDKKANIKKLIPSFEAIRSNSKKNADAVVYTGFKAVKNYLFNMIDTMRTGEEYHVMGARYQHDIHGIKPFFEEFHSKRAKKKIRVNMLANFDIKSTLVPATRKYSKIRFLPQYLITHMHIFLYHETAFIILWAKEPIALSIESEQIVKGFRAYFDAFWNIAKA
jgi:HTH-type transcriptional regulator, sugar sensing transcriptional regulator